ncbi:DEAD-box helicase Dbp80-like [Uloborus diversus]|uniref:DEAD-box helicase Dbp80-like n=1 Tax=Uloborus diversus TaxID=327109 RepID=UPI0024097615|nr:DEAD-box helicase Dbp80-like [Uloborus diversus]
MASEVEVDWGLEANLQYQRITSKVQHFHVMKSPPGSPPKERKTNFDDSDDEPDLTAAEKSLMKKILRTHLLVTTNEVEIERRREGSPLYSVKSFEQLNLPPELLRGVYAMGFNYPSKIQETSLPTLLANPPVNMIAQSQNGTGKTAAFVLASLSRVKENEDFPQVLILAPTYELALQIGEVAKKMAQFCNRIRFRYVVKGESFERGHIITEQVLIGTPGKVFDWSRRRFFDISAIRVFVLDEADVMISTQGHQDQCIRIHKMLSPDCQMLFFSATYTTDVMEFAEFIVNDPITIRLRKEEESLDNVKQYYISCKTEHDKYRYVSNIYGAVSIGQAIIFCRKKVTACWLGEKLRQDGHSVAYLSSDLDVSQRIAVLTSFRDGNEKVLITTNVCARGIDIEQVSLVVNFDLPVKLDGQADFENYLHRIGRSGRFGKCGIAVNMVVDEKDEQLLKDIEWHFDKKIDLVDADDVDDLEGMDR